jgi:hypothetical protein
MKENVARKRNFQVWYLTWKGPSEVPPDSATAEQLRLMASFVSGRLAAEEFAVRWLSARRLALNHGERLCEAFDHLLNQVFYALDEYVIDPALREPGDMTNEQLASCVQGILEQLVDLDTHRA